MQKDIQNKKKEIGKKSPKTAEKKNQSLFFLIRVIKTKRQKNKK